MTFLSQPFSPSPLLFPSPPFHRSITPSWRLSEMEGGILAVETRIDPLACSLHPNLLTPSRKEKSTLSSFLSLPIRLLSQASTTQVTPALFGASSFLTVIHAILLLTPSWYQMWLSPAFAPLFSVFLFFTISNFPISLPISRISTFRPSIFHSLCICSFLLPFAHLLLCTQTQMIKHTFTHPFPSVFPPCCL